MRKRRAELRVRIDGGVYDSLKQIARKEGRTVSELVREAIASLLRERERESETLDSAGKGRGS